MYCEMSSKNGLGWFDMSEDGSRWATVCFQGWDEAHIRVHLEDGGSFRMVLSHKEARQAMVFHCVQGSEQALDRYMALQSSHAPVGTGVLKMTRQWLQYRHDMAQAA